MRNGPYAIRAASIFLVSLLLLQAVFLPLGAHAIIYIYPPKTGEPDYSQQDKSDDKMTICRYIQNPYSPSKISNILGGDSTEQAAGYYYDNDVESAVQVATLLAEQEVTGGNNSNARTSTTSSWYPTNTTQKVSSAPVSAKLVINITNKAKSALSAAAKQATNDRQTQLQKAAAKINTSVSNTNFQQQFRMQELQNTRVSSAALESLGNTTARSRDSLYTALNRQSRIEDAGKLLYSSNPRIPNMDAFTGTAKKYAAKFQDSTLKSTVNAAKNALKTTLAYDAKSNYKQHIKNFLDDKLRNMKTEAFSAAMKDYIKNHPDKYNELLSKVTDAIASGASCSAARSDSQLASALKTSHISGLGTSGSEKDKLLTKGDIPTLEECTTYVEELVAMPGTFGEKFSEMSDQVAMDSYVKSNVNGDGLTTGITENAYCVNQVFIHGGYIDNKGSLAFTEDGSPVVYTGGQIKDPATGEMIPVDCGGLVSILLYLSGVTDYNPGQGNVDGQARDLAAKAKEAKSMTPEEKDKNGYWTEVKVNGGDGSGGATGSLPSPSFCYVKNEDGNGFHHVYTFNDGKIVSAAYDDGEKYDDDGNFIGNQGRAPMAGGPGETITNPDCTWYHYNPPKGQ